ncbi:MAG: MgtC/SapB family protein [Candidatus Eremiobacteraeota bacterium]|nr:MgtC/SapB family protein [Candidatus Eremiobacteraeota bacterium]
MHFLPSDQWPYLAALSRLLLALAVGTFVGLEREQRGHMAGLRTFGLTCVLGCMGGLEGQAFALASLILVALLVVFVNLQALREPAHGRELTTSAALLITGFAGVLCGQGHRLTPVAIAVVTAALLAWKGTLRGISSALTEAELRSAILLAMLTFVVYPALPAGGFGPHQALVPQEAWVTVILIAGVGFVNYALLKVYGNRGVELAGFLGGLVNSTVTVHELVHRLRESQGRLTRFVRQGVLGANAAMLVRNAGLLGVLAYQVLARAWIPYAAMIVFLGLLLWLGSRSQETPTSDTPVRLSSPFSLPSALKFGAILLVLQLGSVLAQNSLGDLGVYATAFLGGLISSASAVGAVAGLAARGSMATEVAARSAITASIASILVNLPLLYRMNSSQLTRQLVQVMLATTGIGIVALLATS